MLPKETIKRLLNLLNPRRRHRSHRGNPLRFINQQTLARLMVVLSKRESVAPFAPIYDDYINNKRTSDKRLRMMTR